MANRTICYNYKLLGTKLKGTYLFQTDRKETEVDTTLQKFITQQFQFIGLIDFLVETVEIIDPFLPGEIDNKEEELYKFICFKSGEGSGPWHMLAGETDSGGLACGANRRMITASNRHSGKNWPEGKHCQHCRKLWKSKEKERGIDSQE